MHLTCVHRNLCKPKKTFSMCYVFLPLSDRRNEAMQELLLHVQCQTQGLVLSALCQYHRVNFTKHKILCGQWTASTCIIDNKCKKGNAVNKLSKPYRETFARCVIILLFQIFLSANQTFQY